MSKVRKQSLPIEELRVRIRAAECPALLIVTAHLTGDPSVLRKQWRPDVGVLPHGSYPDAVAKEVRDYCLERLEHLSPDTRLLTGRPDPEIFKAVISWCLGSIAQDEIDMLEEALQLDAEDTRAPAWTAETVDDAIVHDVAVIGAGLSGLLAGLRLKQAGIPFVIYERGDDLGGTWYFNNYPECRIDVPSHIYTYSFEPFDWPSHFSRQEVMEGYLRKFAADHGLLPHIRFRTDVENARWDAENASWHLGLNTETGPEETVHTSVISAVGQLNKPNIPDIKGRESFAGPAFHSAEWDHSVDFTGKKVAVIGTGASALQFAPATARVAEHVTVFQRTPPWLLPTPQLREEFSEDERWLFQNLPHYRAWYRLSIFIPKVRGQLEEATVDPDYPPTERAISAANDALRQTFTEYLQAQIGDDRWLEPHLIPQYPPGAKRIIRDDGTWVSTLKRPNVSLESGRISEIVRNGIITESGELVEAEIILYGTGFKASDFLMPMSVKGEGGADLHEEWHGNASAYMGVTVPGFPNFYLMYGPNTGVVVHANLVFFMECQANYVMEALRFASEHGVRAMTLKRDVYDEYCEEINKANSHRAWGWSNVSSWYKNDQGRSPIMWPLATVDYWNRTRTLNPDHYVHSYEKSLAASK